MTKSRLNFLFLTISQVVFLVHIGRSELDIFATNVTIVKDTSESATGNDSSIIPPIEFHNQTIQGRIDKVYSMDSSIFENYLKGVDWVSSFNSYHQRIHYSGINSIIPNFLHDDFEDWVVPDIIKKNVLPFYMSGFDQQNRPIWVLEVGKNNYYKFAKGGLSLENLLLKYVRYCFYHILKSMALRSTEENPVKQFVLILDFEGFQPRRLLDPQFLRLQLKAVSESRRFGEKYYAKLICLNINQASEYFLTIMNYYIVRILDRIVIYGTNKSWWIPKLLQILPKESIPQKYGGPSGFKPLFVVG